MTAAESVNEEAVELLAQALSSPSRSWIWGHVSHEGDREWWRGEARDLLPDLVFLLRPSDVPHLERQIRESIAGEARVQAAHADVIESQGGQVLAGDALRAFAVLAAPPVSELIQSNRKASS